MKNFSEWLLRNGFLLSVKIKNICDDYERKKKIAKIREKIKIKKNCSTIVLGTRYSSVHTVALILATFHDILWFDL